MPTITITVEGPIGSTVNEVFYPMAIAKMSNDALAHIFEYGAQRIVNDKCGGKDKTPADKAKIATETIARLEASPYTRRASAADGDPLAYYIRQYFRDLFKTDATSDSAKAFKAIKGSDDRATFLDGLFDKQSAEAQTAIRAMASKARDRAIAERAKTLADAATLSKGMSLKL